MSITRLKQARQMRKGGGVMGSNNGSMLVAPTADGTRPGYYGSDAGFGSPDQKDQESKFDGGSGEGISDAGARRALASNQNTLATNLSAAKAQKEQQAKAAAAKQAAIQKDLDARRGVTPAAYSYGKKINPYDFSKRQPGVIQFGVLPTAMNLAKKFATYKKDKEIRARLGLDPVEEIAMDMPNAPFGRSRVNTNEGGGNDIYLPPINYNTGASTTEVLEDTEPYNQFTYDENAFGPGGDSADVTRASYDFNKGGRARKAEGGIMELRARRAFGGIMNRVDKRQGYFLGGIGKAIKSVVGGVVDATKKVLKSDVGKAAVLGLGIYGYNAGWGSGISSFAKKIPGSGFLMGGGKKINGVAKYADKFNPWKIAGLAMTAAPFIPGPWNDVKEDPSLMATRTDSQLIDPISGEPNNMAGMRENIELAKLEADGDPTKLALLNQKYNNMLFTHKPYPLYGMSAANGGRIGKAEGGLMDLGGMEKDYRAEGGFVPIGEYEKKDDVPARLSVNEFVFTADAVRGAGQGDIDKGAEIMENMMVNLEKGGTVSEESQGNAGAQQMFDTSERLGEVI